MANGKIEFKISDGEGDVAYISMPAHPGHGTPGIVTKQLKLREVCGDYFGPDVYLDFDKDNKLLGIEIL